MPPIPPRRPARLGRNTANAARHRTAASQRNDEETRVERLRIRAVVQNHRQTNIRAQNHHLFTDKLAMLNYQNCIICFGKHLCDSPMQICITCKTKPLMYGSDNNMQPGDQPEQLKNLTPIEQMLISRVQPVLRVYQVKACRGEGQYRYQGNILNIEQDIQPVATSLPLMPHDLHVILVRRAGMEGYTDFRVRRQKVLDALEWLIGNNSYYRDLTIDTAALNQIPVDGNIADSLRFIEEGDIDDTIIEDDNVVSNGIPLIQDRNQRELITNILNWPQGNPNPINEFRNSGYIVKAFPHLFPYGRADYHDQSRPTKVTFREWARHLLRHEDGRFAHDPRFRYFCLNTILRHETIERGTLYANISNFTGTIDDLLREVQNTPSAIKRLFHIGSKITGSNPYWYARRMELEAMVLQLGPPTFFMTLSAADLWWPCSAKHFCYDTTNKSESVIARDMQRQLSANPLIADEYFSKRVDIFVSLLRTKLKIKDFWYRFEYQHRGSPHIHGVFWLEDAPNVLQFETMNFEELQCAKQYYDNLMSAWNPNMSAEKAQFHPSRLTESEINENDDTQLAQLLNRVQRHTLCSKAYCLKGPENALKCRFGYPKECTTESTLEKDNTGVFVYTPKRNDPLLNPYNRYVSQLWRANTDFQIIASEHAVVTYITKYASKSEPSSSTYKEMFNSVTNQLNRNEPASKAIVKLLMKVISQRDVSACEVMHLIFGTGLYHSTRTFVKLYVSNTEYVPISSRNQDEERRMHSKIMQAYMTREENLNDVTLHEFVRLFSIRGTRLSRNRTERIIQLIPKVLPGRNVETDEIYYKQKLLCYLPWRNESDLKTHATWKESYDATNIELRELPIIDVLPEDDFIEDDNIDPHDWMVLAQAMPGVLPDEVNIGYRDLDREMDWNLGLLNYPNIRDSLTFIKRAKDSYVNDNNVSASSVNLNMEQNKVLRFLEYALSHPDSDKTAIVMGPAGTGKSCIINEIVRKIGKESVLLMAPTGVAANNINGQTIHSALKIHNKQFTSLTGSTLLEFQEQMSDIKVVVIDEFSMIGLKLLGKMDQRLRQGKPDEAMMGGYITLFFGDFNQLQPVGDMPLYAHHKDNTFARHGHFVYRQINRVFCLTKIMRQVGPEQQLFRDCLNRLSTGNVTQADYELLRTRFLLNHPQIATEGILRVISMNKEIEDYNMDRLRTSGNPVVYIDAIHNRPEGAAADADDARGLSSRLYLCKDAQVILRQNLFTSAGLCNGTIGKVVDIIYDYTEDNRFNSAFPICVMVEFINYTGPKFNETNILPVPPVTVSFTLGDRTYTRKQFPLQLAYAISVHRSQGLTLDSAVIDIGQKEFALGLSYVAFSRLRNINGLYIDPGFPFDRMKKINEKKGLADKRLELDRLIALSETQPL